MPKLEQNHYIDHNVADFSINSKMAGFSLKPSFPKNLDAFDADDLEFYSLENSIFWI